MKIEGSHFLSGDFDSRRIGTGVQLAANLQTMFGCGGGNHGSDIEIKLGDQALKFTTLDTGGFQNWKEVPAGEIEIKAAGTQRLMIDPVNKVKSAVLDVQKIMLTPVS